MILVFLVAFLLAACSTEPPSYSIQEPRVLTAAGKSISIQVDDGNITLLSSQDDQLRIEGEVLFEKDLEYSIDSSEKEIQIKLISHHTNSRDVPLRVTIHLPSQVDVKVETDHASVTARGIQGNIEVASTSGNITFEQMVGKLTLRSNRGTITVRESSGEISVVGNYGALTLQDIRGEAGASTIMGNIAFSGSIQDDDQIRLEADHGSITVHLAGNSTLGIQIRSTSGDVACMLAGVTSTARTCDGEIGSGRGSLSVRTVSGSIILQSIP